MTPHIADCLHTGAHPHTLKIGADHIPVQHINQVSIPQDKLYDESKSHNR